MATGESQWDAARKYGLPDAGPTLTDRPACRSSQWYKGSAVHAARAGCHDRPCRPRLTRLARSGDSPAGHTRRSGPDQPVRLIRLPQGRLALGIRAAPRREPKRFLGNQDHLFGTEWPGFAGFRPDVAELRAAPFPMVLGSGSCDRGAHYARPAAEIARLAGVPWAEFPGIHMEFLRRPATFAAACGRWRHRC
ncbi:hypothetical protein NKH18_40390 [Streptomyces sp. M10(2022)]